MKCPACATSFSEPVPRCPSCKLSIQRLDVQFGMVPRHSRYLSDRVGKLELAEMEHLRALLRRFEQRFPQILFSVFVTELPAGSTAAEFAFWMANRARFGSAEKTGGENFNLLLVIDYASGTAALTCGYGLEPYLSEDDLEDALKSLADQIERGELAAGIEEVLQKVSRTLKERAASTEKKIAAEV